MERGSWESWDGVSNRASREGNYRIAGISPVISRSFWDKTRLAALSSRVERIRPIILSAVLAAQEGPGAGSAGAKREIRNIISAWHGEPPLFRRPSTLHRTRAMANYLFLPQTRCPGVGKGKAASSTRDAIRFFLGSCRS